MITPPGLTSEPACFSEEAREGPALVEKGRAGGRAGEGFKPAVFTSIRQARWRRTSEPIRIVVGGGGVGTVARPSGGPADTSQGRP